MKDEIKEWLNSMIVAIIVVILIGLVFGLIILMMLGLAWLFKNGHPVYGSLAIFSLIVIGLTPIVHETNY